MPSLKRIRIQYTPIANRTQEQRGTSRIQSLTVNLFKIQKILDIQIFEKKQKKWQCPHSNSYVKKSRFFHTNTLSQFVSWKS